MKTVYEVQDTQLNNYMIVNITEYIQMENNPFHKDSYFGYINENNKFISCKKHKDKNPQALFVVQYNKSKNK